MAAARLGPRSEAIDYRGAVGMIDDASSRSIEAAAAAWLAAEQELASGMSGNPEHAEVTARALSDEYDAAIRGATREELRLAWEAARKIQADTQMGSEEWASARRVSELLRGEYLATDPEAPSTDPPE